VRDSYRRRLRVGACILAPPRVASARNSVMRGGPSANDVPLMLNPIPASQVLRARRRGRRILARHGWSNPTTSAAHAGTLDLLDDGQLEEVHLVAHSMGGLITRLVLESGLYAGRPWFAKAHITACYSKIPCEIFIVQSSKFDAQIPPVTK
jgi:hypothetical protein